MRDIYTVTASIRVIADSKAVAIEQVEAALQQSKKALVVVLIEADFHETIKD